MLLSSSLDFHSNVFCGHLCVCVCVPLSSCHSFLLHLLLVILFPRSAHCWKVIGGRGLSQKIFESVFCRPKQCTKVLPPFLPTAIRLASVLPLLLFLVFYFSSSLKTCHQVHSGYRTKGLGKRIIHHRDITEDLLFLSFFLSFWL